jgi:hypothetical protein
MKNVHYSVENDILIGDQSTTLITLLRPVFLKIDSTFWAICMRPAPQRAWEWQLHVFERRRLVIARPAGIV